MGLDRIPTAHRLTGFINPKDPPYNLLLDGSTDETTAFQTILTTLSNIGGGEVQLPDDGVVGINATGLSIPSNVSVKGRSFAAGFKALDASNGEYIIRFAASASNCTLEWVTIDGNESNQSSGTGDGLYAAACTYINLHKVKIKDTRKRGMNFAGVVTDLVIENCTVIDTGSAGINNTHGIWIASTSSERVSIINNYLSGNGQTATATAAIASQGSGVLISGNRISSYDAWGVYVPNGTRIEVTDNDIDTGRGSVALLIGAESLTFSQVDNNRCYNGGGLQFKSCIYTSGSNNYVDVMASTNRPGIEVNNDLNDASDHNQFNGNIIEMNSSGASGIWVLGAHHQVNFNTIKNPGKSGLYITNGSTYPLTCQYGTAIGNVIYNPGASADTAADDGITLDDATNWTIIGNQIIDDQGSATMNTGIKSLTTSDSNIVAHNNISGATASNIDLVGSNNVKYGNKGHTVGTVYGLAGLAEGTNAHTIKTTSSVYGVINNSPFTLSATDNIAMTACAEQAVSTYCPYLIYTTSGGTVTIAKGTENAALTSTKLPQCPDSNAVLGMMVVQTDSDTTFTCGTDDITTFVGDGGAVTFVDMPYIGDTELSA